MDGEYYCTECGWVGASPKESNSHGKRCPLCFGLCQKHGLKHLIRKLVRKILTGRSRAGSSFLSKHIKKRILERDVVSTWDLAQIDAQRVGVSLQHSDDFEVVGQNHNNNKTWALVEGVE